jgi:hypothetical protein
MIFNGLLVKNLQVGLIKLCETSLTAQIVRF